MLVVVGEEAFRQAFPAGFYVLLGERFDERAHIADNRRAAAFKQAVNAGKLFWQGELTTTEIISIRRGQWQKTVARAGRSAGHGIIE